MAAWFQDAMFYHLYPLTQTRAPSHNDFSLPPTPRLEQLTPWIDHIVSLGMNTVYLSPVFESTAHGYDTADYFQVDRRLGTNETLKMLVSAMHQRGLRVVFDGVFNHVGRDFWAFRDLQANGRSSPYADWFHDVDFNRQSPYGDLFFYEGWAGHYDLVKLNVHHPAVRQHLFDAVTMWVQTFEIDGLRIDAADVLDHDFLRALVAHCRALKADFWLMGEVVHGDYNRWANAEMLNSATNYEGYKGLYSSHVDKNYFEIAYSLNRQFGASGIYRDLLLYSFADNHDVNRVASSVTRMEHLFTLYLLLFTMPGLPSIYYGSEWGIEGKRSAYSDAALRPCIDLQTAAMVMPQPALANTIQKFAAIRAQLPALRYGNYQQIHVGHEQFAFMRQTPDQTVIVAVNAADQPVTIPLRDLPKTSEWFDVLNQAPVTIDSGRAEITLNPHWGSVLVAS